MSEGLSTKELVARGFELQRQDESDPVRGPIVRLSRKVFNEAMLGKKQGLLGEFETFRDSLSPEARKYRLYHYIVGGSPGGNVNLFDMEGEHSIAREMGRLAQKYHIDTDGV